METEQDFLDRAHFFSMHNMFQKLLSDLSVRENNEHYGTRKGGNISLLFLLISNKIKFSYKEDKDFSFIMRDNYIELYSSGNNDSLSELRRAANIFWESLAQKNKIEIENISNLDWLNSKNILTLNYQQLIRSMTLCHELKILLNEVKPIFELTYEYFSTEEDKIVSLYLKEVLNNFVPSSEQEDELIVISCEKHPVFGMKLKDISDRKYSIRKSLISHRMKEILQTLESIPKFAVLLGLRTIIHIDDIINYDLDDYLEFMKEPDDT